MYLMHSLFIAFSTYSRIPVPRAEWNEENKRYSMCFFPMIGAVLGLALAVWVWLCRRLDIGDFLRGSIAAILPVLVTGGIHMDGFMDTMDAMASWQTRERRLQILKDSHTGAFAVIGCTSYLLVSAGLYGELNSIWPMLCVFVLSRTLSALTLNHLPKANPGGMLSGFADAAKKRAVDIACGIYLLICAVVLIILLKWIGLAIVAAAGICLLYYHYFAMKHFGGVTGDLAGWFVQVMELACLAVLVLGGKL